MKKFVPEFKDDTDKIILVAVIICSAFFLFIPALIAVLLLKNFLSESSYNISKAYLNFELLLFIIALFFAVPVIGWILGLVLAPLMSIFNLIIVIIDVCAIAKKGEVPVPVPFEFI